MDQKPSLAPEERPPFSVFVALIWVFGAFLTFAFVIGGLITLSPESAQDVVSQSALSSVVFLFVSALLISRYPGGDTLSSSLGLRPIPLWQGFVAILMGVTAHAPAEALYALVRRFFPVSPAEELRMTEMLVGKTLFHSILLFVFIALVVPVSEEVFFRGAVFGALRRGKTNALVAAIFTSVAFTCFHPDPRLWAPVMVLALLLGAARERSGSLVSSIYIHVGFNGLTMLTSLAEFGKKLELTANAPNVQRGAFAACGFLVAVFFLGCLSHSARLRRTLDDVGDNV